jgi:hypothetical protein
VKAADGIRQRISVSPDDPRPEAVETSASLPWSRLELALFALFAAFIVAGVLLAFW